MNKTINKINLKKEMKDKYSGKDIFVKGKRVNLGTLIKNYNLSELMYGYKIKKSQTPNTEVWETYTTYN